MGHLSADVAAEVLSITANETAYRTAGDSVSKRATGSPAPPGSKSKSSFREHATDISMQSLQTIYYLPAAQKRVQLEQAVAQLEAKTTALDLSRKKYQSRNSELNKTVQRQSEALNSSATQVSKLRKQLDESKSKLKRHEHLLQAKEEALRLKMQEQSEIDAVHESLREVSGLDASICTSTLALIFHLIALQSSPDSLTLSHFLIFLPVSPSCVSTYAVILLLQVTAAIFEETKESPMLMMPPYSQRHEETGYSSNASTTPMVTHSIGTMSPTSEILADRERIPNQPSSTLASGSVSTAVHGAVSGGFSSLLSPLTQMSPAMLGTSVHWRGSSL
jgi:hypothetical protein